MFLFCCALLCVLSGFTVIWGEEERELVAFVILRISCCRERFVGPPRGTVGWSAVCGCGIL